MKRSIILLALIIAAGIGGAALHLLARAPAAAPQATRTPSPRELSELQSQADAACLCERRRGPGGREDCWSRFERTLARYEHLEESTLCGVESTTLVYFPPWTSAMRDSDTFILRDRGHGACSAEEARRRAAAFEAALNDTGCGP